MLSTYRYTPRPWFESALDRFFEDAWRPFLPGSEETAEASAWMPRVDIRDERDTLTLYAEVPGVSQDDLHVEVHNGLLTLWGEKKSDWSNEENGAVRSERVYGTFKRSFRLSDAVDTDRIEAHYNNGVLKLVLPKRAEAAPKQITVQGEGGGAKQIS